MHRDAHSHARFAASLVALLGLLAYAASPARAEQEASRGEAPEVGGFSLRDPRVPVDHIVAGGPSRDAIRSIDEPEFVPPAEADWVVPPNPVLGVALGGEAHVYPVHVIERHQIVNDVLGGEPVAVTYDPLTGTPRAFLRTARGRVLDFGVAGLLYNSGFLLYDRGSESLWSQFRGDAVAGPLSGTLLRRLPIRQETLASWLEREPDSRVLRPPTRTIDYRYSPYSRYWISDRVPSRVDARDDTWHPKEVVVGVEVDGRTRAYLGSQVYAAGGKVEDDFAGRHVSLHYSSEDAVFRYEVDPGVEVTEAYWFAWKAFHPDTEVWRPVHLGDGPTS